MQNRKYAVVWIDHEDDQALQENLNRLLADSINRSREKVGDRFVFSIVRIPAEIMPPSAEVSVILDFILAKCIDSTPDMFMVDYHFAAKHDSPKGYDYGLKIAQCLMDVTYKPVGVFTRRNPSLFKKWEISTKYFCMFIENMYNLLPEGGEGLTGDDWFQRLSEAIELHGQRWGSIPNVMDSRIYKPEVRWRSGQPRNQQRTFGMAATALGHKIFSNAGFDAKRIELEELVGGFSGSFLVRASLPDKSKSWIMKIDEDPTRLERELEGYRSIRRSVASDYYCELLSPSEPPERLGANSWGAIILEEKKNAAPLLNQMSHMQQHDLADLYERVWLEVLNSLYTPLRSVELEISSLMNELDVPLLQAGLGELERYKEYGYSKVSEATADASRHGRCWVEHGCPMPADIKPRIITPYAKSIHGDLNCRNILYCPDKGEGDNFTIRLIDFPDVREGCIAEDFTKAETELVLIMMDWGSGRDCDFERLDLWGTLTSRMYPLESDSPVCDEWDTEIRLAYDGIEAIRRIYTGMCEDAEVDQENARLTYQVHLLKSIPEYIGYQGIPPAKKLLAVLWLGQIISQLSQSTC